MITLRTVLAALLAVGLASGPVAAASLVVHASQPGDQIAKVVEAFRIRHPGVKAELPVSLRTVMPSDFEAMRANIDRTKRRLVELFGG